MTLSVKAELFLPREHTGKYAGTHAAFLPASDPSPMPTSPAIDAVYTWVDGTSPEYLETVRRYSATPRDLNPERFRDSFDLLRHSLRSLERHAPWLRRVYLFTCRPQIPRWLRSDHPRLRIVHHDEVGAPPFTLPTFNSNIIETLLHRLPGLSEHFLYFNDDYLLGAPITPDDFYTPDGRMKICGTLIGERFRSRVYEYQTLTFGLLEHAPRLIDRTLWAAMQTTSPAPFANPELHRFRSPADVRPERFYNWHALTHARDRVAVEPFWRFLRYSAFVKITRDLPRFERASARLLRSPRKFICLNDDQRADPNPAVITATRNFLATLYPDPSTFERADA